LILIGSWRCGGADERQEEAHDASHNDQGDQGDTDGVSKRQRHALNNAQERLDELG